MKKLISLLAIAVAAQAFSISAQEEAPPYENWVGGFVQYYDADSDKPAPTGGLDNGEGFGAELGFRFDPSWAVRFEVGRLLLDTSDIRTALADDGTQIGADLMYFLEDDVAYLFGGVREQSITDSYRMATAGIGKHWVISEDWRVISELAAYHDFGQSYKEFSAKLGLAYIFGKPASAIEQPDTDGDGVYDAVDRCPQTPPGVEVDATGCNVDLDGDGVVNTIDECPRTPAGEEVDEVGCTVNDADRDGVPDADDKCPDTPFTDKVNSVGCTLLEEREVSISLDILFPNDSADIENPGALNITEFAEFMQKYPETVAEIQGHTSAVGPEMYNQALSERRANAVQALLVDTYGIDPSRLTAIGYGETRLKFMDDSEEAHRLNRRIEAKVTAVIEEAVQK